MYTTPTLFINKMVDALYMVLFENSLAPVILGLVLAALIVAGLIKIFK